MTDEIAIDDTADDRDIVLAALATGATYRQAGVLIRRSERTIKRWMSEPSFRRAVAQARTEQISAVTGRLSALAVEAVAVLQRSLGSDDAAESLRAATLILQWAGRWTAQTDFAMRLADIEDQLGLTASSQTEEAS